MSKSRGFTLIELMIVVAIVAIVAAVALPSYQRHVVKTYRASAAGCLMELSQYMERYYTTNMSYAAATLPTSSCQTELNKFYTFAFPGSGPTATAYTITATPIDSQASRDTTCAALTISQSGEKTISGTGTVDACWH